MLLVGTHTDFFKKPESNEMQENYKKQKSRFLLIPISFNVIPLL
jgi:hypothetical protein